VKAAWKDRFLILSDMERFYRSRWLGRQTISDQMPRLNLISKSNANRGSAAIAPHWTRRAIDGDRINFRSGRRTSSWKVYERQA
jgi:hypothetical protein